MTLKPVMNKINFKVALLVFISRHRKYVKDVLLLQKCATLYLRTTHSRRKMFKAKWQKVLAHLKWKIIYTKDKKMKEFINQVEQIPESVVDHIAKKF